MIIIMVLSGLSLRQQWTRWIVLYAFSYVVHASIEYSAMSHMGSLRHDAMAFWLYMLDNFDEWQFEAALFCLPVPILARRHGKSGTEEQRWDGKPPWRTDRP